MARLNTNEELWTEVTEAGVFRDQPTTPASSTLSADEAAGSASIAIAAASTFADDDFIRIGSGNDLEVAQIKSGGGTTTLTLYSDTLIDHLTGATVYEQVKVNLGDVSEDGITRETSVDRNEFRVATQAGVYATLITSANARMSWNLVNHSYENVLASLGIPETNVTGAGSVADPYVAHVDPEAYNTASNESLYFQGALKDGTTYEIRGFSADYDANQTMTYARGNPALLPLAADVKRLAYITPV
jgi:hypothetical protein